MGAGRPDVLRLHVAQGALRIRAISCSPIHANITLVARTGDRLCFALFPNDEIVNWPLIRAASDWPSRTCAGTTFVHATGLHSRRIVAQLTGVLCCSSTFTAENPQCAGLERTCGAPVRHGRTAVPLKPSPKNPRPVLADDQPDTIAPCSLTIIRALRPLANLSLTCCNSPSGITPLATSSSKISKLGKTIVIGTVVRTATIIVASGREPSLSKISSIAL